VNPAVAKKSENTPKHAWRLYRAGRLGFAHIRRFSPELFADPVHDLFRRFVIAENGHPWFTALKPGLIMQSSPSGFNALAARRQPHEGNNTS
jgi:hypothetical protein